MRPTSRALSAALLTLALAACGDASPIATGGPDEADPSALAVVGATDEELRAHRNRDPNEAAIFHFRSEEDPAFPADPALCAQAGFTANVLFGAALYSEAVTARDGRVVNGSVRRIGRATACARITDPTFPPGLPQSFYAVFDLPEGRFVASGACTLVSNDVPVGGLVLAGCHLRVLNAPARYGGGAVASLSVFNPRRLPGFDTGSEWVLQVYPRG